PPSRSARRCGGAGGARPGRLRRGAGLRARPGIPDAVDDVVDALLAQDLLHAADGVALAVQEMADATQEVDVVGPVVPPPAAALHRLDLGELALPEPQHMLGNIEFGGYFTDGPEGVRRLFQINFPRRNPRDGRAMLRSPCNTPDPRRLSRPCHGRRRR